MARCLADAEGPKSGGPGPGHVLRNCEIWSQLQEVLTVALSVASFTLNVRLLHFMAGRKNKLIAQDGPIVQGWSNFKNNNKTNNTYIIKIMLC